MNAVAPARAANMLLPRRAVSITACLLSVLLFVIQVTNAAACFPPVESSTEPAQPIAKSHGNGGTDEECEERALLTSSLPKSDDTKQDLGSIRRSGSPAADLPNYKPLNEATRGVPVRRDKAPLYLQTARLRI